MQERRPKASLTCAGAGAWRTAQHRLRLWELDNATAADDQRAEDERRALADEMDALSVAIAAAEPGDWREIADMVDQLAERLAEPWAGASGEPDPETAHLLGVSGNPGAVHLEQTHRSAMAHHVHRL
ncbi:hypothetical protein [Amphiplicatus metriothermophilus]|uniref:Uncharacterized protein n=1 Tax=Amphiplicatus metriothermophilus TaxID=1519374 RepID=A0A239PUT2_9PROT|nr:hypothetical protein [Amphiplicatus metriothermophilus]MBB5519497.1 hypothetical protein [Amphiplicatus metriothermophilus]SNT74064.1 hypothetical protein SAMN06297382_1968 [Amphiplicatus metriothermophilus]